MQSLDDTVLVSPGRAAFSGVGYESHVPVAQLSKVLCRFTNPPGIINHAALLGLATADTAANHSSSGGPATFYGARIQPVFAGHCVTCHGRNKHKANLRLDSYDAVMRGGKHGPVIKTGEPKGSELFHRITLPASDDDFMPPDNRRPLSPSDVKLIELWISSGASGTQSADAIKDLPSSSTSQAVAEVTFDEIDSAAVAKQRASLAPIVANLQQRFPNVLDYQSRSSADLVVDASWMGSKFGDNDLAVLLPLSERVVAVDLSNTSITDRSASTIAAMKHLRLLRLMHSKIGDRTVQALGSMDQLESLSIFDTPVTSAALPAIAHLPKLLRMYAGETKISPESPIPQEFRNKIVF